jgi:Glycosyl transferase family 90
MYTARRKSHAATTTWILSLWTLSAVAFLLSLPIKMVLLSNTEAYYGSAIRQQSISNSQYLPTATTELLEPRPFPRWGATLAEEQRFGLDFGPVLDFIVHSSPFIDAPLPEDRDRYIATSDHGTAIGRWYPEVLYVLDHDGLSVSELHRTIIGEKGADTLGLKITPMERKMMEALELFRSDPLASNMRWPRLTRVLTDREASGFPFLLWHGDYTECSLKNWKERYSIPLFTVAASVNCNYTFPFPNHVTVADVDKVDWNARMEQYQSQYAWKNKLPQIVWRGGLTGKMANATQRHQRWTMVQRIQLMKRQYDRKAVEHPFLFNVGATNLPRQHLKYEPFLGEVGGIVESMEMEDFQQYRGIIDLDGNSWSSRFGQLLCYNSVILKVEPQWVDYFYYPVGDGNDQLQPWVHYIPVQSDLSDLVELSEFVADPSNDAVLTNIVSRANNWCRAHMVPRQVATDMLDIWERYVELLDVGDAEWNTRQWPDVKRRLMEPASPLRMNHTIVGRSPDRNRKGSADPKL